MDGPRKLFIFSASKGNTKIMSGAQGEAQRKHTGRCIDCGAVLQLYKLDLKKGRRMLVCSRCGLYHFYKKDFLGKWKLLQASKVDDMWTP